MVFLVPFCMEMVGSKEKVPFLPWITYKTLIGNLTQVPFAIFEALMSLVAMFISDWSTLQWTVSAATFLQLLLWFVVPESPRWLIANNKHKEAANLLKKAAKVNKRTLSPLLLVLDSKDSLEKEEAGGAAEEDSKKYGLKDLFGPELRVITIVLWICWPVVTLGYYGISFSMANLGGDLFTSFIIVSLVEVLSLIHI